MPAIGLQYTCVFQAFIDKLTKAHKIKFSKLKRYDSKIKSLTVLFQDMKSQTSHYS